VPLGAAFFFAEVVVFFVAIDIPFYMPTLLISKLGSLITGWEKAWYNGPYA
jgi:hypothetical protein